MRLLQQLKKSGNQIKKNKRVKKRPEKGTNIPVSSSMM